MNQYELDILQGLGAAFEELVESIRKLVKILEEAPIEEMSSPEIELLINLRELLKDYDYETGKIDTTGR